MSAPSSTAILGPVRRCGVILRGGKRCAWCQRKLRKDACELDHVVPRCEGGKSRLDNLVPACPDCNFARTEGDEAFAVHLAERSVKLSVARRRVRRQLARPIDRNAARLLAVR